MKTIFKNSDSFLCGSVRIFKWPDSKSQLDAAICNHMKTRGRTLRVELSQYSDPVRRDEFIKFIFSLAVKYQPWQFRTVAPGDGSVEISWVETDRRLGKYKK